MDIFKGIIFDWEPMKEIILRGIFEGVREVESFPILDVPGQVISRVACLVAAGEKARVRIGWLDNIIGEIYVRRNHSSLGQKEEQLSFRLTELQEE